MIVCADNINIHEGFRTVRGHELDGLVFEVARELEREVFEGRYHRGRGHVVQIVGRKPAEN